MSTTLPEPTPEAPMSQDAICDPMPVLRAELLALPDPSRLEPAARATHPPRILLLYGSLRERSFSHLLVEEADRLLRAMGAETRIFDPRELPVANSVPKDHTKVLATSAAPRSSILRRRFSTMGAVISRMGMRPSTGKTSPSRLFMQMVACRGTHVGDRTANQSRATASKVFSAEAAAPAFRSIRSALGSLPCFSSARATSRASRAPARLTPGYFPKASIFSVPANS